ncbi:hypothetical protein J1605_004052 [Eschrichtius robustus]|uniref:Uncharacterized protein n=1 Tax=Eschrichtius robustus TaxID=9764 RepID=A0AB34HMN5_ESCRO|nr:hypothetical protein J1605_004052 [Eschrichtius robustus]
MARDGSRRTGSCGSCCCGSGGGGAAAAAEGAPGSDHPLSLRSPHRGLNDVFCDRSDERAPPEPGRGICLPPVGGKGAGAGPPPLLSPPAPVSRPGPPGTRRGSRKKVCWESPRFWQGGEGLRSSEEAKGRPRRVPRARTPDSSGLRREGAAAGPGRACARARCHPWGLVSAPGLAPFPSPAPSAARRPRAPGRLLAGVVRPVRAACPPRPLPKARRPERDGLLERFAGSGGGETAARADGRGLVAAKPPRPAFRPNPKSFAGLVAGWQRGLVAERTGFRSSQTRPL